MTTACGIARSCNLDTASHTRGDKCPSPPQFLHVTLRTSLATPKSLRLEILLCFCMICTKAAFPFMLLTCKCKFKHPLYVHTVQLWQHIQNKYFYCLRLYMHNDTDLKNIFVIFETGHNGTSLHACTGSPCSCGMFSFLNLVRMVRWFLFIKTDRPDQWNGSL